MLIPRHYTLKEQSTQHCNSSNVHCSS